MAKDEEFFQLSSNDLNAMTTQEAALAYAGANLLLIPVCNPDHIGASELHKESCNNPGKAPRITQWSEKATADLETVSRWFQKRPESNVGMLTGSKAGIVGIDADGDYGASKVLGLFGGEPPLTWTFSTPGGGTRYLFGIPKGTAYQKYTDRNPNGGHEELAILADGQMTVLPPSLHRNGGKYEWLPGRAPGDIPLTAAPQAILNLLTPKPTAVKQIGNEDEPCEQPSVPQRKYEEMQMSSWQRVPSGDLVLNELMKKCEIMYDFVQEQKSFGCDEDSWHKVTSMLVRAGHPAAALAFSQISGKHNPHSEQRITQMAAEGDNKTYGPTCCRTFGCGEYQITKCFGTVRTNDKGEITNSPALFVSLGRPKKVVSTFSATIKAKTDLLPERYSVNGSNLCLALKDKDGEQSFIPQANFFAWINKDTMKDDGAERQRFYELEGCVLYNKKRLSPILVPANDFESMKWLSMWGPEPNIQPGNKSRDTVRHAIQSTASEAVLERIYAHLGWVEIDGSWAYLHAGGALGVPNIKVEPNEKLKNFVLSAKAANAKKAMEASLRLLDIAPHRITLVLWAMVFLAPLCEWLRLVRLEPKFLVWFHGYTGSRKTTYAKLMTCHFGDLLEHPPASFKDTANTVEKCGFDAKDSLLLIDDYHPTDSPREAKTMMQIAQQILRGYGDRVGRGRMKQDTSLRQDYPPRGMAIVTAEDVLSGSSSVARLFPVGIQPGDIDLEKLTVAQQQASALSEAMTGYLEWIGAAMDEREDTRLTQIFFERRNEASRLNVHGRLTEAASWLYLGLSFGLEYAVSIRAIESERKQQLLDEAWNIFLSTANHQGQQVTEVKPTTRFINIVAELLASQSICTEEIKPKHHDDVPRKGTLVGWHDNDFFYFLPEVLYNNVSRFLSAEGTQFPITSQTLWKQLADEGIIKTETSKENGRDRRHLLVKKDVRGERSRKLWVRAEILQKRDAPEPEPQPEVKLNRWHVDNRPPRREDDPRHRPENYDDPLELDDLGYAP
ncbi:bifunctional DNA primase/polymerase [Paenibacillus sp. NEAU-GSW1]|uniref:bifunctional DNA primase/polymerase n=1 Tax=Paenibacillus sp. NEAU-GSW1 TaxID=2682486 RepID=UPI0012E26233|nr:bifunctional DNA primase/polymerase [Paenibacillus sp. NEAU-GSW1]MUT64929.1 hypothetical protein [Paenibacillus sp. NEAU-GSW1]